MSFTAETRIEVPAAESLIASLCTHLEKHGTLRSRSEDGGSFDFGNGTALLRRQAGTLHILAEASSEADLLYLRMMLASHVVEMSEGEPRIVWSGDGAGVARPPNFRVMTVLAARDITPHMRRLTLKGDDLSWFDSPHLHVRLFIPPGSVEPEWPRLLENGLVRLPQGPGKPHVRKYTIRHIDVAAGTLDVDFVTHEVAGPGSDFVASAQAGDPVGMAGPGGGGYTAARWNLFAGDETALPAIARMLESMPRDGRGLALIEVANKSEEQTIPAPEGVAVRWLHRNGAEPGTTDLLLDAVRAVEWPDEESHFTWVACEFEAFRKIRTYLRKERHIPRDRHLVVAYWRRGQNEDSFATVKHGEE